MELELDRSPRLLARNQLRQDFAQPCRQPGPRLSQDRASESHLTSALGCDPASSAGSPGGDRPAADFTPAGGRVQVLPLGPGQVTSELPCVHFSLRCWLPSRVLGQTSAPPGCCLQSSSAPCSGDWRTPSHSHCIIRTDFALAPLLCPGRPRDGLPGCICHQGLLAPCWLRGQGLAMGFSLRYIKYCICLSPGSEA